ncbi:hypothetical protein E4T48_04070 [Aureobasidium sp. EXF-10727]|nr:hypothetical protein E4T48_04070 [Aureobasidium sp. EXF-10727]
MICTVLKPTACRRNANSRWSNASQNPIFQRHVMIDDEAWGAQMRTHYIVEENNDKLPANLEVLEAEREKRKKNYVQIAHE